MKSTRFIFLFILFSTIAHIPPSLYSYDSFLVLEKDQIFKNLQNAGIDSQSKGNFEAALNYYERAHKLIVGKSAIEECTLQVRMGLMKWNLARIEEATENYSTALAIATKHSIQPMHLKIENVLNIHALYEEGKQFRNDMQFQDSINSFQEAIALAHEINSNEHKVKCLRHLCITYRYSNDLSEFLEHIEEALVIAEELNHKIEESYCNNNIGWYHMEHSNYSTALQFFNRALQLAEELDRRSSMPDILNNLGIIYKNLGEYDQSLANLNRALEIDREFGNLYYIALDLSDIGTTLRHIARNTEEGKYLEDALMKYSQSLDVARGITNKQDKTRVEISVFNNIGSIYFELEDYEKALAYFKPGYDKAVELNEIGNMGMLLNNMGIAHSNLGNYSESTALFYSSIDLGTRLNSGLILWEAYLELGRNFAKQDLKQDALVKYMESIDQIEKIRSQINIEEFKASFMGSDKRLEAYQEIIGLLVELHKEQPGKSFDELAFNYLERGKARAFLDSLEASQVDIAQNADFKLLNREAEITKEITTLYSRLYSSSTSHEQTEQINDQIEKKESELDALKGEIRSKSPIYASLKYPSIVSLKEAQKLLDSQTAFLEYSVGKEKSFAFIINRTSLNIEEIPSRDGIKTLVVQYLNTLSDKNSKDFSIGHQLYNILVNKELQQNSKKIIVIADDILHYLPFETLIVSRNGNNWLINTHEIAYASSISSLSEIIERKNNSSHKTNMEFLGFGDPYFGTLEKNQNGDNGKKEDNIGDLRTRFPRLTFSGAEIEKASALFKSNRTNIFKRENATEENLRTQALNDYKIIHFATHGEIDDEKPIRSNIAFAYDESRKEVGILQAREIYGLELNADLVTISACRSGLGKFIRGEGIEGLNRAFFYAGASAVAMSLWTVNDQATSQLMERFYSYIRKSNSIMSSLRTAKLELINSEVLAHPYYWAGFIVSGKSDHVIIKNRSRLLLPLGLLFLIGIMILLISIKKKRF